MTQAGAFRRPRNKKGAREYLTSAFQFLILKSRASARLSVLFNPLSDLLLRHRAGMGGGDFALFENH